MDTSVVEPVETPVVGSVPVVVPVVEPVETVEPGDTTAAAMAVEHAHAAHNYHPLPVVVSHG